MQTVVGSILPISDTPPPVSGVGHGLPARSSVRWVRSRISERTVTEAFGNESEAPIPAIRATMTESL
jgi:hypothetical protein